MSDWREYANRQRQKRTQRTAGKGPKKREADPVKDEIVVQRMSSEVNGKQQKYSRIGAREYVPFEHQELTLSNIKDACQKHFGAQIDKDLVCDILAGERGPSCKKMEHVPDLKVFYVRFIKRSDGEVIEDEALDPSPEQAVS